MLKEIPTCYGAFPNNPQERAENCCHDCKYAQECYAGAPIRSIIMIGDSIDGGHHKPADSDSVGKQDSARYVRNYASYRDTAGEPEPTPPPYTYDPDKSHKEFLIWVGFMLICFLMIAIGKGAEGVHWLEGLVK